MEGEFVSFLPGDNQDLASAATASVIELINNDLSQLLRLPPQQFWQVVLADKSLHTCLDSFLRFRRRCYDDSPESIQGSSDLLLQLSQRVFRVYWRMVHPHEAASSSSSSSSATSKAAVAAAAPSPQQVADLLYNKWLLDVPKMLDLAVLYGPGNSILTGQLLQQLLLLQPKYAQDILTLAEPLSGNLHELSDNVCKLANKVLSTGPAAAGDLIGELAEAVKYFTDAFLTLQAFVTCLPAAAALLLHPSNHGSLLIVLALIYSSVLPLLQRVAQQPGAAAATAVADGTAVQGLRSGHVLQLQHCVVSLVYHLLTATFCTAEGAAAAAGPDAIAAAAAASGGSSSSGPKGSQQQQQQRYDLEVQGQELMNVLMLVAHPSEHMYQQQQQHDRGGLLAAANHTHHLDVAVATAMDQGLLALDDAQFDYMLALVDGDRQLLQQRQQHSAAAATTGNSSSQTPTAGSSSSTALPPAAELSAKIQSIKELLPDYGDGFLTAALYHNSFSTEQTINCLLEGSLPKALQGLDPLLKTWTPSSSSSRATQQAGSSSSSTSAGLSWTGLAKEAAAAAAAAAGPAAAIPLPSLTQAAAAVQKPALDRRTGRILGALPGQVRSLTKNIAYELQYEYDDEYDDSFDDLVGPGNDGVCDIEGEETAAEAAARKAAAPGVQLSAAAAAADEYADEPAVGSSSAPRRPQQQQQQQQQGRKQKDKLWVLDGKIYNYKKDGATEVAGMAGAEKALKAAKQAALEIHGLGPGGNVPLPVEDDNEQRRGGSSSRGRGGGGETAAGVVEGEEAAAAALVGAGVHQGLAGEGWGWPAAAARCCRWSRQWQ